MTTAHKSLTTLDADLGAMERSLARQTLITFTQYTNPNYEANWHHLRVANALDRVLAGITRLLMILMPPQNGKSELVSRRFPAYAFGKRPNIRIIGTSYGDSLAQDMSRDVQKIMDSSEYHELFPEVRLAESSDVEKRTQGQFDVVGGKGYYIGSGIMGSITGKTSDIGIIDDPIKNRSEAESKTMRDRVWDQITSAFSTRQFGDQGAIILCMTPWHLDDPAHRFLRLAAENTEAGQWEVIRFPAIATEDEPNRKKGEPLWPLKYPMTELRKRQLMLGPYDWSALYQLTPIPPGGSLFKMEWFANKIVDVVPALMRMARGWDTAGTEGDGDYTCGVKIGEAFERDSATGTLVSTGQFYVLDVQRDQLDPNNVDRLIRATAELDGQACAIREEKEGGSAGVAVIEARRKALRGKNYDGVQISGSKVTRSKPFRQQCAAGNVFLLRGRWNKAYLDELTNWTGADGERDDQVDGSSCAFNAVLLEEPPFDPLAAGMQTSATW